MWLLSIVNRLLKDKLGSSPSKLRAEFTFHPSTLQLSSELISIGNRAPVLWHFSFIRAPLLDQSFARRIRVPSPVAYSAFLALRTSGFPCLRGNAKSTFANGWYARTVESLGSSSSVSCYLFPLSQTLSKKGIALYHNPSLLHPHWNIDKLEQVFSILPETFTPKHHSGSYFLRSQWFWLLPASSIHIRTRFYFQAYDNSISLLGCLAFWSSMSEVANLGLFTVR